MLRRFNPKNHKQGFTIVELLIVIVVIAILAAIAIVAFSGIQVRARNTARIAAATEIARALDRYTILSGTQLPGIPACVPTGEQDYNGDGVPDCGNLSGPSNPNFHSEVATTNAALGSQGVTGLSFPGTAVTGTNGTKYAGVSVTAYDSTFGMNGKRQPYFALFYLEGADQDCGSNLSIAVVSNPDPLYRIAPARNYLTSNGMTVCAYTLQYVGNL